MRRIFNLTKNIISSNFKVTGFPYRITFILTYRCNLKCKFCNIWKRDAQDQLSLEEIEKFFQKNNTFNWINISGGEIFLRDDIVKIIKIIANNCKNLFLIDFPTNGFLTGRIESDVKEILNLKNLPPHVFVTVSLDGANDLHDALRGVRGSWMNAVETFRRLRQIKDKRLKVFFGMTISSKNVAKIEETINSLKHYIPAISYRDLHVNLLHSSEHYYQNDDSGMADENDLRKYIGYFRKKRGLCLDPVAYLEVKYQSLTWEYLKLNKTPLPCKALISSCFIAPNGDIFPCSIMNKTLGNIRDYNYDLAGLWNAERADKVRQIIKNGLCPQCWTPCEAYQTILGNLFSKR
jgi:radical SAM protein with 4Fe4S-binding SPASM domain